MCFVSEQSKRNLNVVYVLILNVEFLATRDILVEGMVLKFRGQGFKDI